MTDKQSVKITDDDIVKALECCVKTEFISGCAECGMFAFDCKDKLIEYALDLINRQKAEIENLNIELKAMRGSANWYKAEVARLRTQQSELIADYKNIAINAIKNFAEKLTEIGTHEDAHDYVSLHEIEAVRKEMIGK